MNNIINKMLERYDCRSLDDYKNALKEIMQEIALLGLSRAKFFDQAVFYGGTALRIVYGSDRFSEDLDFSLIKAIPNFDIGAYLKSVKEELNSYGLNAIVEKKQKVKDNVIQSAFIRSNTLELIQQIQGADKLMLGINKNDTIKIKIEVDTDPSKINGGIRVEFLTTPIPHSVKVFDKATLFAGKIHAILCRQWKTKRVKGRDYYDFVWFASQKTEVNVAYLKSKMKQTGHLKDNENLTISLLKKKLKEKIRNIDLTQAKDEVRVFIKDTFALDVWSIEFFDSLIDKLN